MPGPRLAPFFPCRAVATVSASSRSCRSNPPPSQLHTRGESPARFSAFAVRFGPGECVCVYTRTLPAASAVLSGVS